MKTIACIFLAVVLIGCNPVKPEPNRPPVFLNEKDTVSISCVEGDTARYVIRRYDPDGDSVQYTFLSPAITILQGRIYDTIILVPNYTNVSNNYLWITIYDGKEGGFSYLVIKLQVTLVKIHGFAPLTAGNSWTYRLSSYFYTPTDTIIKTISVVDADTSCAIVSIRDSICYINPNKTLSPGYISPDTVRTYFDTCYFLDSIITSRHLSTFFSTEYFYKTQTTPVSCNGQSYLWLRQSTGSYYNNLIEKEFIRNIGFIRGRTSYHGGGSHATLLTFNNKSINFFECLPAL